MEIIKDSSNLYLKDIFQDKYNHDTFESTWLFYSSVEELDEIKINISNFYIGLWEYSNEIMSKKVDEWNRAFRRNNLKEFSNKIINKIDFYFSDKKVYFDLARMGDFYFPDIIKMQDVFLKSNSRICFFSAINSKTTEWLDDEFIGNNDVYEKQKEYINKLDEKLNLIILNGYHHGGEKVLLFINKKGESFFEGKDVIERDGFEKIYQNIWLSYPFPFNYE